jgi:hypothetical protein
MRVARWFCIALLLAPLARADNLDIVAAARRQVGRRGAPADRRHDDLRRQLSGAALSGR